MRSVSAGDETGALWLATLQRALARASHDVKDALNGVSVNLEVIRSRAARPGSDGASAAPFAEAAAQQLERLTNLIEAVLALGRAEREPADVGAVLRRVATLCSTVSSAATVAVDITGDPAMTPVRGDAVRLALAGPLLELVGSTNVERAPPRSAGPNTVRCTLSNGSADEAIVVTVDAAGQKVGMPDALADAVRAAGVRWEDRARGSPTGEAGRKKGEEGRGGDFSLVFPRA